MRKRDVARDFATTPFHWAKQVVHNSWGILQVLDLTQMRPLEAGLVGPEHPFCTGKNPDDGEFIWHRNVVFATERRQAWDAPAKLEPHPDEQIIERVGRFMAKMVRRAATGPQQPDPKPSRMPPAINYLHGGVHYNGAWLLFNDFAEAIEHFSDPRFRAELRQMVDREDREPLLVFRKRNYDRKEYARFVCFLRSQFGWFSNSNGPRRRVLWGNPGPYATVNMITGRWIRDVRSLRKPDKYGPAPRAPISQTYFKDGPYDGYRSRALPHERALAKLTRLRLKARGGKENLFFVDKRRLDDGWMYVQRRGELRFEQYRDIA